MNDSSSNRWKRAERHPEKHQILMQFFFVLFFRDRQFFFLSPVYIYEQFNDVQKRKRTQKKCKKKSDYDFLVE